MPTPAKSRQDTLSQPTPSPAKPTLAVSERTAARQPNRALRGTLLWALLYNLIGLTVVALLWQAMP
ncbi:hypothetical protein [Methylobacterium radiodurans]|nr:hypothetical protein [Methylobacterium radiodurans]